MKRFALFFTLILIPLTIAFADGNATTLDNKTITVSTLQSGDVEIKTPENDFVLEPDQRAYFIDLLKAHTDFLNTATTEKISIKSRSYTGRFDISLIYALNFWVYLNEMQNNPYVFEMSFANNNREVLDFTYDGLNAFIKVLEDTKSTTDDYRKQANRVDALVRQVQETYKH